jgi:putative protease
MDTCSKTIPSCKDLRKLQLQIKKIKKNEERAVNILKKYREAIDTIYDKREKPDTEKLLKELFTAGNRGFIPGFFAGHPDEHGQRYDKNSMTQTHTFAGKMVSYNKKTCEVIFAAKNKIDVGDILEILTPTKTIIHTITEMKNEEGELLQTVHPGNGTFKITLKEPIDSEFCVARWEGQQKRSQK